MNYITVNTVSKKNLSSLRISLRYLKKQKPLAIFPEGKLNMNKEDVKAKEGATFISQISKVPIIPVGIEGTIKILSSTTKKLKIRKAYVSIGKPIYGKGLQRNEMTNLVMREINKLRNKIKIGSQTTIKHIKTLELIKTG